MLKFTSWKNECFKTRLCIHEISCGVSTFFKVIQCVEGIFVEKSKDQKVIGKKTTKRVCLQNDNTLYLQKFDRFWF
jgi:hypothetical protein